MPALLELIRDALATIPRNYHADDDAESAWTNG
jgi:hypothetical protein